MLTIKKKIVDNVIRWYDQNEDEIVVNIVTNTAQVVSAKEVVIQVSDKSWREVDDDEYPDHYRIHACVGYGIQKVERSTWVEEFLGGKTAKYTEVDEFVLDPHGDAGHFFGAIYNVLDESGKVLWSAQEPLYYRHLPEPA